MKEQQSVSALQDAFKKNGIETRKLPRAAALRVSFMGAYHRVTYAGEGKGWLVNGYNEDGDPAKISELRSLCEELSREAIAPVAEEAIGSPEPSPQEDLASITTSSPVADESAANPEPAQGEDLRQLQSAIKGIEGTTYCNKAPRQNGLLFDFQEEQYRVDVEENDWVVKLVFGSGQHLEHLQKLVPSLLATGEIEEEAIAENPGIDPADLCAALNDNFQKQGLIAKPATRDQISITFLGKEFSAMRKPCDPSDWYIDGGAVLGPSLRLEAVRKALYQILQIFWDEEDAIATPGEEIEEAISIDAHHMAQILSDYLEPQGAQVAVNNPRIQVCFTNTGDTYLIELNGGFWQLSDGSIVLAMASADNSTGFSLRRAMIKEAIAEAYRCQVEIAIPGEEIEEAIAPIPSKSEEEAKAEVIKQMHLLSFKMGVDARIVCAKITGQPINLCSLARLQLVLGRLKQISRLVGSDDSEPIPDEELSEDEREANAFGAQFVENLLCGYEIAPNPDEVKRRHYIKWIHKLANLSNVAILPHEAEYLKDPEECPLADLKKIIDRLLSFPKTTSVEDSRNRELTDEEREAVRQGEHYHRLMGRYHEMRSHQDEDHGEPINYRPSADKVAS